MAFNGSGTYTLPGAALNTGDTVSATENNTLRNDMATAFNKTLCRDGQATPTANLPMGGFKLTGLAAGTASGESVRYDEFNALNTSNFGFRNRIINGAMMIDQRNAGASITPTTDGVYSIDRWITRLSQASKYSIQQNAGAVTPPVGFINYLGVTSLSSYSVGASDYFELQQRIEGLNVSDLAWGTANAKTVTLSFQVYSSLTGNFGGCLSNSAGTRTYPFSYTVSSANTWTSISVTIAGDTTGTWLTTNGIGIIVNFGLGVGSSLSGTANTWAGTFYGAPTGSVSVVGTNGATFYITGVQLEKGSTATSFDYRPYGTELALCQRYLPCFNATGAGQQSIGNGSTYSSTAGIAFMPFQVQPRTPPTGVIVAGSFQIVEPGIGTYTVTPSFGYSSNTVGTVNLSGTGLGTGNGIFVSNGSTAQIQWTGCEL